MEQGADHFARGDWVAAYDAWSEVGLDGLSAAELDQFSTAAGLVGHNDDLIRALQRAFIRSQEEGDRQGGGEPIHVIPRLADRTCALRHTGTRDGRA